MRELIKNETINICQQELVNKKVENCTLVYDASAGVKMVSNSFVDCDWLVKGHAAAAFEAFNEMLKFGAIKIVDGQMVMSQESNK